MVEFAELEQRILDAFARIGAGVEVLSKTAAGAGRTPSAAQSEEIARLQAALDVERAARLAADAAQSAVEASNPDMASEVARLTRQLDAQGLDSQRLRSSVAQLREELRRLREAAETGLADAPLINRALQAELEALRAVRSSETTEMADILAALGPLIDAEEAQAHAGH